ncbi:hypothetical protein KAR91_21465 [Candidatus Pacearchaeota archaeon]|nr:hypothetical protein [Candidatus Pacearchaeota archaeon]
MMSILGKCPQCRCQNPGLRVDESSAEVIDKMPKYKWKKEMPTCICGNTKFVNASANDSIMRCTNCGNGKPELPNTPDQILSDMAETFKKNQPVYGDNWKQIGNVMLQLFPEGRTINTPEEWNQFHLFFMIIVKITRLSNSPDHKDSAHDIGTYAAMLESVL